jgi:hypothetical protein
MRGFSIRGTLPESTYIPALYGISYILSAKIQIKIRSDSGHSLRQMRENLRSQQVVTRQVVSCLAWPSAIGFRHAKSRIADFANDDNELLIMNGG